MSFGGGGGSGQPGNRSGYTLEFRKLCTVCVVLNHRHRVVVDRQLELGVIMLRHACADSGRY